MQKPQNRTLWSLEEIPQCSSRIVLLGGKLRASRRAADRRRTGSHDISRTLIILLVSSGHHLTIVRRPISLTMKAFCNLELSRWYRRYRHGQLWWFRNSGRHDCIPMLIHGCLRGRLPTYRGRRYRHRRVWRRNGISIRCGHGNCGGPRIVASVIALSSIPSGTLGVLVSTGLRRGVLNDLNGLFVGGCGSSSSVVPS